MTLTKLGLKYNTDKATYHDFTDFYALYLEENRYKVESLLEIGIYNGASLRMWEEYFPNADIYGIDIDKNTLFNTARINTYECSQVDFKKLNILFEEQSLDIIVDDGSHMITHQIKSFKHMIKFLKPNGTYILEDLHSSYMRSYIDNEVTTIEFLKNIDKYKYGIDFIEFFHHPVKESITSIIKFK